MKVGELDLLDGSPPCQAFSTAGTRAKQWGKENKHSDGTTQRSDDLFFQYARLLKGLKPKVFIAENVSGLVKGVAKGYFKDILRELKACGYVVEAKLLDAQWLGVPQQRQRVFFVGVRNDLAKKHGLKPAFPNPLPYRYTVFEAIGDLIQGSKLEVRIAAGFRKEKHVRAKDRPSPTIGTGSGFGNNFNNGSSTIRFMVEHHGQFQDQDFTDKVVPTIRATAGGQFFVHETEHGLRTQGNMVRRKFKIEELKRICAFPDDFTLTGSYSQRWARLGNSVPPLMMRAVGMAVRDQILAKLPVK
jgi:DNA (cytosine-5)-methyltransferase 1